MTVTPEIIPSNEAERMRAVRRYEVLDTPPDGAFDRITALSSELFDVPISLVTIVDEDRIWFKSRCGLDDVQEISRDPGLCASAILQDTPYIIEEARRDPRTLANPLVRGQFGLQFYAAAPLRTEDGYRLGTLCIIDREPRVFSPKQADVLDRLSRIVMDEMELRLSAIRAVAEARKS
ncbi:MAG TPA: GAF domain-containing protein [Candidatus Baltobacteraceae bacterium]|jgi:GAF domain-containing protein|nr:GAF domain-containing protein [Candidatus Baltobacteraceae bacterium]